MAQEVFHINIWINEERYEKLQQSGLAGMTKDVLAGLKVIQIPVTGEQRDALLQRFPTAKCDTATTKTIELLPRAAKDGLFNLVVQRRSATVAGEFINSLEQTNTSA